MPLFHSVLLYEIFFLFASVYIHIYIIHVISPPSHPPLSAQLPPTPTPHPTPTFSSLNKIANNKNAYTYV